MRVVGAWCAGVRPGCGRGWLIRADNASTVAGTCGVGVCPGVAGGQLTVAETVRPESAPVAVRRQPLSAMGRFVAWS